MANYQTTELAFKKEGTTIKLKDGTTPTPQELELYLISGSVTYTETGRTKVEIKSNGRRLAKPTVVETEDNDITGSLSVLVGSFTGPNTGPADTAIRQWMLGQVPAFVSTGNGGAPQLAMQIEYDNTEDDAAGGVSQFCDFSFVTFDEIAVDTGGGEGLVLLTASFTAREVGSRPAYS